MSAATKAEENAGAIVYEVLGRRALDVDTTIIEYIINVLKDESFDFGVKGDGAFEAVGDLLVDSGCVDDEPEARLVCGKLSEKNWKPWTNSKEGSSSKSYNPSSDV